MYKSLHLSVNWHPNNFAHFKIFFMFTKEPAKKLIIIPKIKLIMFNDILYIKLDKFILKLLNLDELN